MSVNKVPATATSSSENNDAENNETDIIVPLQPPEALLEAITEKGEQNSAVEVEHDIVDPANNICTNVTMLNENTYKNSEVAKDLSENIPPSRNSKEQDKDLDRNSYPIPNNASEVAKSMFMATGPTAGCSNATNNKYKTQPTTPRGSVELFTDDNGPQMYNVKGSLVTQPIITKNLPKVFEYLPVYGKPKDKKTIKEFFSNKIREFVGCDLSDYEFKQLEDYCSPEQLKTGKEMVMGTSVPVMGVVTGNIIHNLNDVPETKEAPNLCILKKNKMRNAKDNKGVFLKKLKYRGVRNLPFTQEVYHMEPTKPSTDVPDVDLEPGKDILYRVRVYRPYTYNLAKDRFTRTRHSVFCCDIILTGRHKLSELRDRFVCHNDFDMRVDVSNHPDMLPNTKAKEVFPSGFLFINNVFYVDTREGCIDYSEPIRDWATKKNLGDFPKKDMCEVKLEDLVLKLGYPEVYVHQGNCEHVFLFSEIRLLNPTDPLRLYNYPCTTAIAQNQTVYCTTCAEFSAKWIVVGCSRVPFDPAFFCETCFKQYLYKNGEKIGDFKAYSYRGNALNVLKPQ